MSQTPIDIIEQHADALVPTQAPATVQQAYRLHNRFVLALMARGAVGHYVRGLAAEIMWCQAFFNIQLGETGQSFGNFKDWFDYALREAGVSAQTKSGILNFCEYVVNPVRLFELPFTLEQLKGLDEHRAQRLGSAAKRLINSEGVERLSDLIQAALDLESREAFEDYLQQLGLRKQQVKMKATARLVGEELELTIRLKPGTMEADKLLKLLDVDYEFPR
jgi:hypothetical protein